MREQWAPPMRRCRLSRWRDLGGGAHCWNSSRAKLYLLIYSCACAVEIWKYNHAVWLMDGCGARARAGGRASSRRAGAALVSRRRSTRRYWPGGAARAWARARANLEPAHGPGTGRAHVCLQLSARRPLASQFRLRAARFNSRARFILHQQRARARAQSESNSTRRALEEPDWLAKWAPLSLAPIWPAGGGHSGG